MREHRVTRYNLIQDNSISNCDCGQGRKSWIIMGRNIELRLEGKMLIVVMFFNYVHIGQQRICML